MKRAGIFILILLMFYNISFSLCYNTRALFYDTFTIPKTDKEFSDELILDISDDAIIHPSLMDSEFSNINARCSYFEKELNLRFGLKEVHFLDVTDLVSSNITKVIANSILVSNKYFIPTFSLNNLLNNLFILRI